MSKTIGTGSPHGIRLLTCLKVIRRLGWATRTEIVEYLGAKKTVEQYRMLYMLHEQGFLEARKRARTPGMSGSRPIEFRVADEWRND